MSHYGSADAHLNHPPPYTSAYNQPYSTSFTNRPPSYPNYQTASRSYASRFNSDAYLPKDTPYQYQQQHFADYSKGLYHSGSYNYSTTPRNYSSSIMRDQIPEESDCHMSNDGSQCTSSPKPRFRSPEDYHYDYRGGYRPTFDNESRDGYTTDGSGSGYREGSTRGYENFRYPESESLIPRDRNNPFFATQSNGTSYAKGDGAEKQPFIGGVEPVRLTPSWEQRNVSREELNFKNVKTYENFEVDAEPPTDRLYLVFLTFVLHGIGTLMPWNMFITAKDYFVDYKLKNDKMGFATNFLIYIGIAAQIPNVLFNWLNIFIQIGGGVTVKIVGSIVVEVIIFIVTVILAMIDSADWPTTFFGVTVACVVILNIAVGVYQNTIYGLAARLPFKYTGAVVLGSNISGTLTALLMIASISMTPDVRTTAIYYFIAALFILLVCFDTYFALPLNRYYRYQNAQYHKKLLSVERTPGKPRTPFWYIFKKVFPQLFNVFLVFFVTLAVFPAVLADIRKTDVDFFISKNYFRPVTCFLTFNLFAMIGNMLPGLFMWPGPRFLFIPVVLRLAFIPAFLLCHFYPYGTERTMPVLIDSDYVYWVLAILLGLSSGYYSSLAMMYCPKSVEPEYAPVAGMMGAASLITGIFAGVNFQWLCIYLVTQVNYGYENYEDTFRNSTIT